MTIDESSKKIIGEKRLQVIRQIFDIGFATRLTPCYVEWLVKTLRKGYWKLSVLPFVKISGEDCSCGYAENRIRRFRGQHINHGNDENLHQAIHCLNKYRGIPFEKINLEQKFRGFVIDVEGEISPEEKYVVVELGELSTYDKFFLIHDPIVQELWFDGKGEYFYSLRVNDEIPIEESLCDYMFDFYGKEGCSPYDCLSYSRDIIKTCDFARYIVPIDRERRNIDRSRTSA